MKYNVEALKQAVKAIENNPESWDQRTWTGKVDPATNAYADIAYANDRVYMTDTGSVMVQVEECRTTFCLAGQVMLNAGMVDAEGRYITPDGETISRFEPDILGRNSWETPGHIAAEILGLDEDEADQIFYYGTGRDRIENGPATVDGLKRRITEVTGITFEE